MNDRFHRLLIAVGVLLGAWLLFGPQPKDPLADSPGTTEERGRHGQRVAAAWLTARGYGVHSHRRPWVDLQQRFPQGHVLISDLRDTEFDKSSSAEEDDALKRWVAAGNTWIAMIGVLGPEPAHHPALDEQPPRSGSSRVLERGFGWSLRKTKIPDGRNGERSTLTKLGVLIREAAEQQRKVMAGEALLEDLVLVSSGALPSATQAARAAVEVLSAGPYRWTYRAERSSEVSDYVQERCFELTNVEAYERCLVAVAKLWSAQKPGDRAMVLLRAETQPELEAAWAFPFGRGWVVVSAAGFWSNANIAKADNAWILEHWLKRFLAPGGAVVFDDYRQGLSEVYDHQAFYADPRLHYTLWVIALVWLAYAVGRGARLLPPRAVGTSADSRALVLTLAEWYARKLRPADVAAALVEHFLDRQRRRLGLCGDAAVVWAQLAHERRLAGSELEVLRRAPETVRSLGALLRLLSAIERADRRLGTRANSASARSSRTDSAAIGEYGLTTTFGESR